ncbi:putative FAD-binding oxidoreductase [Lentithecium fluviatile CBS 122367]|uniref:Putative FAD-binding oxidoreductase n=1 Tax=Lentithecium fluviatile CBS 122367 TaxID=1168545 RepID=A0A6G1JEK7_9PLEO|nr:putative FAD-binding oxidoreductase [Lentithecium fluviatile CBS 122367]
MLLILLTYLLAPFVAASTNATQDACRHFQSALSNSVVMPSDSKYSVLSTENWSATAWGSPACIVEPGSTADVQMIVSYLSYQQVRFAIRSGGHSPSPFGANTDDGVLIDLSSLNTKEYDAKSQTVKIGAGLRWGDVYRYLDQFGVTAVGARVLDVGVGGLLLGSGLSYLSDLYGMACDNVVNFEVIIADGSVVNANASYYQDLYRALKGGANNFGVVGSFTLRTYPIQNVWGGIKIYANEHIPALYEALAAYQAEPNKDLHANLMLQPFVTNQSFGAMLNMVYLKPEESPAAFKSFYMIPTVGDTTKLQTLTEMISGQIVPSIPRWDWHTTSFTPSAAIYEKISSIISTAPEVDQLKALTAGTLVLGFQPISSNVVQAGIDRSENVLGLDNVNQTWLVLDIGWWKEEDDATAHNATRSLLRKIENATKSANSYVRYIFMNDASWDQPVIDHYGTNNVRRMRQVRSKYDPTNAFYNLVSGGFKLSL